MDFIISTVLYLMIFWLIFRLGEYYAYFKIAKGLANLKEISAMLQDQDSGKIEDKVTIEEIDGHYYAYINDIFVGQGATINDAKGYVEKELKRKHKISSLELVSRESE